VNNTVEALKRKTKTGVTDLPNIKNSCQCRHVNGELNEPPVLDVLGDEGQDDDTHGPEALDHAACHRPVRRPEQFQHHGVCDTL
jgi:hypothetical protein